jgi:hypothetical protein
LQEIEDVAFGHLMVAPDVSDTVAPLVSVAVVPVLLTATDCTTPLVVPSADVID